MSEEHGTGGTGSDRLSDLRKVARYVRLYGWRWTLAKLRNRAHLARAFHELPARRREAPPRGHVGLIGCGSFAYSTIAHFLTRDQGPVFRGVMDRDPNRAASLYQAYGADFYTEDEEEVFADPRIDMVFVASNHASHAEYAIRALQAGQSVHIEKPHVVTLDQLRRLCAAMASSPGRVAMGFNRPVSDMGRSIIRHLHAQSGPAISSWAVTGHRLSDDHWYAKPEEGGRVFGNLCHWTDFSCLMVPADERYPIRVRAFSPSGRDDTLVVTLRFGNGSATTITFSATHEPLEGVGERLTAQRGGVTIRLDDFQRLRMETPLGRREERRARRDMGHRERIRRSYALSTESGDAHADSIARVWEAGEIFLQARASLVEDREIQVHRFSMDRLVGP